MCGCEKKVFVWQLLLTTPAQRKWTLTCFFVFFFPLPLPPLPKPLYPPDEYNLNPALEWDDEFTGRSIARALNILSPLSFPQPCSLFPSHSACLSHCVCVRVCVLVCCAFASLHLSHSFFAAVALAAAATAAAAHVVTTIALPADSYPWLQSYDFYCFFNFFVRCCVMFCNAKP